MLKKLCIALFMVIVIICLNTSVYATIRGDADGDTSITAFDAYLILKHSVGLIASFN